jgi:hypothetical protein
LPKFLGFFMSEKYCDICAGELAHALKDTNFNRSKKPLYIDLEFYTGTGQLSISESEFGKFDHLIPAKGANTWNCQLDGVKLAKLVSKFNPEAVLRLTPATAALIITQGKSKSLIPITGTKELKGIQRTKMKPDPRHTGMPVGIDAPLRPKTDKRQTWLFSARIPMPNDKN